MNIPDHLDRIHHRVLQDAFILGTAAYWRTRAAAFDAARPRPGDYTGRATADDLRALDQRNAEAARACRARAEAAPLDDLADLLGMVA